MNRFLLFMFLVVIGCSIFVCEELKVQIERNNLLNLLSKNNHNSDDETFYEFINRITHGKIYNMSLANHDSLKKMGYHFPPLNKTVIPDFDCDAHFLHNFTKATSVHRLTPYDINIIGALGDSLTAGFGACAFTLVDLFIECRGVSWSIGGDGNIKKHVTLPNILKEYNPKLTGYSVGISPPLIRTKNNNLNVAVSGSTSLDMYDQAQEFVQHLITDPKYDYFGSWKLLTLFVGGNDLCACCRLYKDDYKKYSPENYVNGIMKALDYLHERVPKLFINLINAPDVTVLNNLSSFKCDITHFIECKCGTVYGKEARNYTQHAAIQYHQKFQDLVNSGRYDTRDDFTVVIQPFFDETSIPRLPNHKVDRSYFAPDCFHFSRKAHAASALGLWNNMMEPVGNKNKRWKEEEPWKCPSRNSPYFYTNKNSKQVQPRITSFVQRDTQVNSDQTIPLANYLSFRHQPVKTDDKYDSGFILSSIRHAVVNFHTYLTSKKTSYVVTSNNDRTVTGAQPSDYFKDLQISESLCLLLVGFMLVIILIFLSKVTKKYVKRR